MELGVLNGKKINPQTTLVIFDEIQFCNAAITSLTYFYEQTPEYHIMCAGSLLGITLSKPLSFPVGKVDFLTLRPMCFYEFVLANEEEMLLEYIEKIDMKTQIPQMFADKFCTLLKTYFVTGGMPEVVATWVENKDVSEVERMQVDFIAQFEEKIVPIEVKASINFKIPQSWSISLQIQAKGFSQGISAQS